MFDRLIVSTDPETTRARPEVDASIARSISALARPSTDLEYWRQDELTVLDQFLEAPLVSTLAREVTDLQRRVVRRSVAGYKSGGSLPQHLLAQHATIALAIYHAKPLIELFCELSGMPLVACHEDDRHGCAVYWYDQAGDGIGFHRDSSWYQGARYTVLLGIEDRSSSRLLCKLHAADKFRPTRELQVATGAGNVVFFNGDKLLHAVSPLQAGERRIVLSLQYVTDRRMTPLRRAVSYAKDTLTYFGFDANETALNVARSVGK